MKYSTYANGHSFVSGITPTTLSGKHVGYVRMAELAMFRSDSDAQCPCWPEPALGQTSLTVGLSVSRVLRPPDLEMSPV